MRISASQQLRRLAAADPQRPALITSSQQLTYAELDAAVEALAAWLIERVTQGDVGRVVTLRFLGTYPAVVSTIALDRAGLVCALVDPLAPAERLRQVLAELSGQGTVPLLLTDNPGDLAEHSAAQRFDDITAAAPAEQIPAERELRPEQVQSIVYTSGSTGVPVGLEVTGMRGVATSEWARTFDAFAEGVRVGCLSAGTLGQSSEFPRAILAEGGTMNIHDVLLDGLDGVPAWLRDGRIEAVPLIPTAIRILMPLFETELAGTVLESLRTVVVWGEATEWDDLALLARFLPPDCVLHNAYATTETGMIAALSVPRTELSAPGERPGVLPAGTPLPGVHVRILDHQGREVPPGSEGEVVVAGPHVSPGHWARPDLTAAETFERDGLLFWRTGDGGRLDRDGTLHVSGRLDDVVKIAGHRIALAEVEQAARRQPGVLTAAAVAREHASGAMHLHLFLVPEPATGLSTRWVRSALARTLPPSALPHTVTLLDELPTLPNGKVNRRALPEPAAPTPRAEVPGGAADDLVTLLRRRFAEALQLADVGPDDDFFDLGGDSLRAVELVAPLQGELGRMVPGSLLMEAPTPASLAAALQGAPALLVPVRSSGTGVPLFVLHGGAGEVLFARRIAQHLDADTPVYALQPDQLQGPVPMAPTLPDVAARYVEQIRQLWPHGPYRLFGFSLGGVIAFEMALQLRAAGAHVSLLALGDTLAPGAMKAAWSQGQALLREQERAESPLKRVRGQLAHRRDQVQRRLSGAPRRTALWRDFLAGGVPAPAIQGEAYLHVYGRMAYAHSLTAQYPGEVRLIVATRGSGPDDRGWGPHVSGRLVRIEIDCVHDDLVLEPAVAELGAALAELPAVAT